MNVYLIATHPFERTIYNYSEGLLEKKPSTSTLTPYAFELVTLITDTPSLPKTNPYSPASHKTEFI